MELSTILKELVRKQEEILNNYNYDIEKAEKDQNYNIIKTAIEQIVNAINRINNREILSNSYLFVNESLEEVNLGELIKWEKINEALKIDIML